MGSKTKIYWCDSTWNPVTGCLHGCDLMGDDFLQEFPWEV